MKAYRSFFLCSLCAHILLLAFAATLIVTSPPRSRNLLRVTIFQKAVPLPMGEPTGPAGGRQPAPPPEPPVPKPPEPVVAPPPKTPPQPPKKVRKKVTPRPSREIVKPEPPPEPLPPVENYPMIGIASEGEDGDPLGGNTSTAATGGEGGVGSGPGTGSDGAGLGRGGGGGTLARPNYGVNPKPPYPLIARRMGAEGVVVLRVFVHADGSVGRVELSRSSGFNTLDESAVNTVRERWRFLPARQDGQPVESWVEVPIRFVLERG
ncbi:MAG: energy transducer TonB [Candidatus Binatia bacterium]